MNLFGRGLLLGSMGKRSQLGVLGKVVMVCFEVRLWETVERVRHDQ